MHSHNHADKQSQIATETPKQTQTDRRARLAYRLHLLDVNNERVLREISHDLAMARKRYLTK